MICDLDTQPPDGTRVGRYILVRDVEGRLHGLAAGAVSAVCQTDDGCLLLLPGGRMVHSPRPLLDMLGWLDGRK